MPSTTQQVTVVVTKNPYNEHYDAAVSASLDGEPLGACLAGHQLRHPHWEGQPGERVVIIHGDHITYVAGQTEADIWDAVKHLRAQAPVPA